MQYSFKIPFVKIFFYCVLLCFGSYKVSAQEVKFYPLTLDDGLSNNTVIAIYQDSNGFVWFGTQNGLNRYDGVSIKNYKHETGDKHSLVNNYINQICEKDGLIWVATAEGVSVYNPKLDLFTSYREESLLSINAFTVQTAKDTLWVGTDKGVQFWEETKNTFETYYVFPQLKKISTMCFDATGKLFYGTIGEGLFCLQNGKSQALFPEKLGKLNIRALTADQEHIYVGTERNGLFVIHSSSGAIQHFYEELNVPHVWALQKSTHKDEVWVGTDKGGLTLFNIQKGSGMVYLPDDTKRNSISGAVIRSIYTHNNRELWVGTFGKGVNLGNLKPKPFQSVIPNKEAPITLTNSSVLCFENEANGNYWIGTDGGGIHLFDQTTKSFQEIPQALKQQLADKAILDLVKTKDGNLWIGTYANGLYQYHEPTKKLKAILPDILQNTSIWSIITDGKGHLWIGTHERGVLKYAIQENKIVETLSEKMKPEFANSNTRRLMLSTKNKLWIGTFQKGVIVYNLSDKSFQYFKSIPSQKNSLSHNLVVSLYEDEDGTIWAGTYGGGLNQFDRQKESFRTYTQKDGLPNDIILGINQDSNGFLWISTQNGLSKFDKQKNTFTNFYKEDGLQSNQYNVGANFKNKDGVLFFGGGKGFDFFTPELIVQQHITPKTWLTGFKLVDKMIDVRDSSFLTTTAEFTKELTLSYKDDIFTLFFSTLNYIHSEKNEYQILLEGFDEDWRNLGTQNFATFTNLDAGTYTLYIKASNNDGIWSEAQQLLTIHITPPWWETWWARTIVLILIVGGSITFYKIRTNILKKQNERLEQMVDERTHQIQSQNEELYQQAEEIAAQRDQIEEQHSELSTAYQDTQKVGAIGKLVTQNLSLINLVESVFHQLSEIVDIDVFLVGEYFVHHKILQMTWKGHDQHLNNSVDELNDVTKLTSICFEKGEKIIIDDFTTEAHLIEPSLKKVSTPFQTQLYYPLIIKDRKIGVVGFQSQKENAFSERQVTMFEALVSYIAIGLENTIVYGLIQSKNDQITSSIKYAQTIQQGLLPKQEKISGLFSDSFVIFKPKDIVSGDFYWMAAINGEVFFASVDCTGHGVPGAFMSMIGISMLNRFIKEQQVNAPHEILHLLNDAVCTLFTHDSEGGMDMTLVRFTYLPEGTHLAFAGAKNKMIYFEKDSETLQELKGDRFSIGYSKHSKIAFTQKQLTLQKGSELYFMSDGFVDQNNESRKSFSSKRLKALLQEVHTLPMTEQKILINQALENHQGDSQQRDDISMIGIRV